MQFSINRNLIIQSHIFDVTYPKTPGLSIYLIKVSNDTLIVVIRPAVCMIRGNKEIHT